MKYLPVLLVLAALAALGACSSNKSPSASLPGMPGDKPHARVVSAEALVLPDIGPAHAASSLAIALAAPPSPSLAVPPPSATAASAAPAPRLPFILRRDEPVNDALQSWSKRDGWELIWYPAVSWRVLRDADLSYAGDVTAAVAEVVNILRDEGKPVRLRISDGNRVMEVLSTEVRND